jgi:hypothetical protein
LLQNLAQQPAITLPASLPKKWVVDCRHVGKGLPALQYLSRYLYRGVLPDSNIISDIDGQVSFTYISSRGQDSQTQTRKV